MKGSGTPYRVVGRRKTIDGVIEIIHRADLQHRRPLVPLPMGVERRFPREFGRSQANGSPLEVQQIVGQFHPVDLADMHAVHDIFVEEQRRIDAGIAGIEQRAFFEIAEGPFGRLSDGKADAQAVIRPAPRRIEEIVTAAVFVDLGRPETVLAPGAPPIAVADLLPIKKVAGGETEEPVRRGRRLHIIAAAPAKDERIADIRDLGADEHDFNIL